MPGILSKKEVRTYMKFPIYAKITAACAAAASVAAILHGTPGTKADPPPKYLVRESGGIVAVYSGQSGELITSIDYPVAGLPRADRVLLSEGIAVESDDELAMLLEDYQG